MDSRYYSNGGDNDFRANDEGWDKEESYVQSERNRRADAEQAYRLAKYRASLDYDSRLDFL